MKMKSTLMNCKFVNVVLNRLKNAGNCMGVIQTTNHSMNYKFLQGTITVAYLFQCIASLPIQRVHVTFMNHLDIGFNHGEHPNQDESLGTPCYVGPYPPNCGFAYSVINAYFDWFFPQGKNYFLYSI
jgi:hypothetical protein